MDNGITLLTYIKDKKWNIGAELGVRRGDLSHYLLSNTIDLYLYMIDLWPTSIQDGIPSLPGESFDENEDNMKKALEKVSPYIGRYKVIREKTFLSADKLEDRSLDFVYIDSTHSEECLEKEILSWKDKLKPDGYFCGHDFHDHFDKGKYKKRIEKFFPDNLEVDEYTCWFCPVTSLVI